ADVRALNAPRRRTFRAGDDAPGERSESCGCEIGAPHRIRLRARRDHRRGVSPSNLPLVNALAGGYTCRAPPRHATWRGIRVPVRSTAPGETLPARRTRTPTGRAASGA